ncbi:MAG: ATP-binding cassette domain-containing protein [Acidimicrobiales bacterium]
MSEPEGREAQSTAALTLRDVGVRVDGRALLQRVDWTVTAAQRWVLLGPNGSGKTTLVRVASLQLHPSSGDVTVLGETLGRTDVRTLRTRIGLVSAAVGARLRPALPALDVVMTARHGALEPWWHRYDDADRERAHALLARFGVAHLASHRTETLSSGERQRVLLARLHARSGAAARRAVHRLDLGARGPDRHDRRPGARRHRTPDGAGDAPPRRGAAGHDRCAPAAARRGRGRRRHRRHAHRSQPVTMLRPVAGGAADRPTVVSDSAP